MLWFLIKAQLFILNFAVGLPPHSNWEWLVYVQGVRGDLTTYPTIPLTNLGHHCTVHWRIPLPFDHLPLYSRGASRYSTGTGGGWGEGSSTQWWGKGGHLIPAVASRLQEVLGMQLRVPACVVRLQESAGIKGWQEAAGIIGGPAASFGSQWELARVSSRPVASFGNQWETAEVNGKAAAAPGGRQQ